MTENVGSVDRTVRSILGPSLMAMGYFQLGGNRGRLPGLLSMMLGVAITESAITRVCPINSVLGLDTRRQRDLTLHLDEGLDAVVDGAKALQ